MAKLSKRAKLLAAKVDANKLYVADEALALVKECANAKFTESIDVAVQLGVDPKKSDQTVRGSVVLPAGTGKTVRVAVFAQGEKAEIAKAAGAEIVGMEDLAEQVKAGNMDFDIVIATPDVETAVKNAKAGQVQFRVDKGGIIHATLGRATFEVEALKSNLQALVAELIKLKPASSNGVYIRKVALSSTMGVGVRVDTGTVQ